MTSFRRVAPVLGLVALCGGALMFSVARGQDGAAPAPAAPAASTGTGSPVFKHTIGISPVQTGLKSPLVSYTVLGGTGNETYDLQSENIYSLLRQRGAQIPNVLHPLSTAKPSFIVERLIVLTKLPATGGAGGAQPAAAQSAPAPGANGAASSATNLPEANPAAATVSSVRAVVDAEISRGTGRLGGGHLQKLRGLRAAVVFLEKAELERRAAAAKKSEAAEKASDGRQGRKLARDARVVADLSITEQRRRNATELSEQADQFANTKFAEAENASGSAERLAKQREADEYRARLAARNADLYVPKAF